MLKYLFRYEMARLIFSGPGIAIIALITYVLANSIGMVLRFLLEWTFISIAAVLGFWAFVHAIRYGHKLLNRMV